MNSIHVHEVQIASVNFHNDVQCVRCVHVCTVYIQHTGTCVHIQYMYNCKCTHTYVCAGVTSTLMCGAL